MDPVGFSQPFFDIEFLWDIQRPFFPKKGIWFEPTHALSN